MGIRFSALRNCFPFFHRAPFTVLMLGLDSVGKTTILYRWKMGDVLFALPSIGFNVEEIQSGNVTFSIWDICGPQKIKKTWHLYYNHLHVEGLIYVVDSNDEERMQKSKRALMRVLSDDSVGNIPVLILANKQDLPKAKSVGEIHKFFELDEIRNPVYIQGCTGLLGEGIHEGLDWLGKNF
eukprot:Awhi_evm1s8963